MTRSAADRPLTTEELETALLARLGLPPRSSSEDVDAAHRAVTAYLAHAPRELKDWARVQAAATDEAYGLLIDPAALADSVALVGPTARPASMPGGPATPPARRDPSAANGSASKAAAGVPVAGVPTPNTAAPEPTFEELLAEVTPSTHRDSALRASSPSSAAAPSPTTNSGGDGSGNGRGRGRLTMIGGLVVGALAVAFVGYQLGGANAAGGNPGASPAPSNAAVASPSPTVDQATVATLMGKIQANPKDADALMALADEYYRVEDFTTAETWLGKLLAVDEEHIRGLLALGAIQFNTGRFEEAKANWDKVVVIEPDNIEAHYDLGFYWLQTSPDDKTNVVREWGKVIEIDPDSDIAKRVKTHLDALVSPAPSPSAGASAVPSGSPAASPAASPAPSTSAAPSESPQP